MENIPQSLREVKQIISAIDLITNKGLRYLGTKEGICEIPFEEIPDASKEIAIGEGDVCFYNFKLDYDEEIIGDGPPYMFLKRDVKPGDVKEYHLVALRCQAMDRARLKEIPPADLPRPEVWEEEIKPRPEVRKENVVQFPRKEKKKDLANRPAADVLKYGRALPYNGKWETTLTQVYLKSEFRNRKGFAWFHGKRDRKGRFYFAGNNELERATGLSDHTIERHMKWMKSVGIIKLRDHGMKDQRASTWELPYNLKHVMAWKRGPKKISKKS
jgi:hypothetical protein